MDSFISCLASAHSPKGCELMVVAELGEVGGYNIVVTFSYVRKRSRQVVGYPHIPLRIRPAEQYYL